MAERQPLSRQMQTDTYEPEEVKLLFAALARCFREGTVTKDGLRRAMGDLVFYDVRRDLWTLGASSGSWYRRQGQAWVRGEPRGLLVQAAAVHRLAPIISEPGKPHTETGAGQAANQETNLRCASCATVLPANARFCLNCGKPVSPGPRTQTPREISNPQTMDDLKGLRPGPTPEQALAYFKVVNGQFRQGLISSGQYRDLVNQIVLYDSRGDRWMIGANSGKWYVKQGRDWGEGSPAGVLTFEPPAQSAAHTAPRPRPAASVPDLCTKCGNRLRPQAQFCNKCGAPRSR